MSYPSFEQYNAALQNPQLAFFDPELQAGKVATTGLGLPLALCGGFALTYSLKCGKETYAVRCFHKESHELEQRYKAISDKISLLQSPYFLNFQFYKSGIRINNQIAPIVKMTWAAGDTLGEFFNASYQNKSQLNALLSSLRALAIFIEKNGIAHGDIQTGNVMVANGGNSLQLIDYDGMYVDAISSFGGAELGHRNFQHPKRSEHTWNAKLDRFSLIELILAIKILEVRPDFWNKTNSDSDAILFRANDFADPDQSSLFRELYNTSQFSTYAKNFAAICKSSFDKIPTLEDFINQQNIPQILESQHVSSVKHNYISAFPVLNADDYELCLKHVGDRVELIGKIVEVSEGETRRGGRTYFFINFGDWRGKTVKLSIWPKGLKQLSQQPDKTWEGKWISVNGLIEPPYSNKRFRYTHLAISITQDNQMHFLQESEAFYRLGSIKAALTSENTGYTKPALPNTNQNIITAMKGSTIQVPKAVKQPVSQNQSVLQTMRNQQTQSQSPTPPVSPSTRNQQPQYKAPTPIKPNQNYKKPASNEGLGCLVVIAIIIIIWILTKL